jgi:hypothetical protein
MSFSVQIEREEKIARDFLPLNFTMAASQKSPRSLFFESVEILVKSVRDWGHIDLSALISGCGCHVATETFTVKL